MKHHLKILPEYYAKVLSGQKTFELRKDDRGFEEGHTLVLEEYDLVKGKTGKSITKKISYVLRDCARYGLMGGHCILGLAPDYQTQKCHSLKIYIYATHGDCKQDASLFGILNIDHHTSIPRVGEKINDSLEVCEVNYDYGAKEVEVYTRKL